MYRDFNFNKEAYIHDAKQTKFLHSDNHNSDINSKFPKASS